MSRLTQRPVVLIATGLLGAGVILAGVLTAGSALAGSPDGGTPTPTPTGSPGTTESPGSGTKDDGRTDSRKDGRGGHRLGGFGGGVMGLGMLGGRALHGEVVLEQQDGSGTEVMLGQRGKVTARSDTSLSVRSSDGYAVTWTVNDDTKVRATSGPDDTEGGGIEDVAVGDEVAVGGPKGAGGGTASVVVEPGAWPGHGWGGPRNRERRDQSTTSSSTSTTQA
jgi:hypothetical protein